MKDMHNSIKVLRAVGPAAVGTTGASNGTLSGVIDRQGYESVEFVMSRGVSAAATDTITPVLLEADATNGSFTSVADADLLGTEADAVMLGNAATQSKLGYRGNKRYLKLRMYGVGTATAVVAGTAILGEPHLGPVA
ncbi:MAG: hypothetical protein AB7L41_06145 [Flavobacteriaceae bacterium]